MPLLHRIPAWKDEGAGLVHLVVETPAGSQNKYDYDPASGALWLDRPIHSALRYPADYGFVPGTLSEDGDPLDALLLIDQPTFPGCVVPAHPIAVLRMRDEDGPDPKLVCVAARDPRRDALRDLADLPDARRRELAHFFTHIKDLEAGKWAEVGDFEGRAVALELVAAAVARAGEAAP